MDEGRSLTAQAVADLVGGRLFGDGNVTLRAVGALDRAEADTLSFLASARFRSSFGSSRAGAVLITPELAGEPGGPSTRIVTPKPQEALQAVLPLLYPTAVTLPGLDPSVRIGRGARLGEELSAGPFVTIGDGAEIGDGCLLETGVVIGAGVRLGRNCRLGPHVVCHPGSTLGSRVVIKAGAVIGGTGFGYLPTAEGHVPIPHVGRCVLEDDVHVGSHTC
ncbi:MAG: LpxD N-terminal domain-containing protein, partial [Gemmatimonadales bacterium]